MQESTVGQHGASEAVPLAAANTTSLPGNGQYNTVPVHRSISGSNDRLQQAAAGARSLQASSSQQQQPLRPRPAGRADLQTEGHVVQLPPLNRQPGSTPLGSAPRRLPELATPDGPASPSATTPSPLALTSPSLQRLGSSLRRRESLFSLAYSAATASPSAGSSGDARGIRHSLLSPVAGIASALPHTSQPSVESSDSSIDIPQLMRLATTTAAAQPAPRQLPPLCGGSRPASVLPLAPLVAPAPYYSQQPEAQTSMSAVAPRWPAPYSPLPSTNASMAYAISSEAVPVAREPSAATLQALQALQAQDARATPVHEQETQRSGQDEGDGSGGGRPVTARVEDGEQQGSALVAAGPSPIEIQLQVAAVRQVLRSAGASSRSSSRGRPSHRRAGRPGQSSGSNRSLAVTPQQQQQQHASVGSSTLVTVPISQWAHAAQQQSRPASAVGGENATRPCSASSFASTASSATSSAYFGNSHPHHSMGGPYRGLALAEDGDAAGGLGPSVDFATFMLESANMYTYLNPGMLGAMPMGLPMVPLREGEDEGEEDDEVDDDLSGDEEEEEEEDQDADYRHEEDEEGDGRDVSSPMMSGPPGGRPYSHPSTLLEYDRLYGRAAAESYRNRHMSAGPGDMGDGDEEEDEEGQGQYGNAHRYSSRYTDDGANEDDEEYRGGGEDEEDGAGGDEEGSDVYYLQGMRYDDDDDGRQRMVSDEHRMARERSSYSDDGREGYLRSGSAPLGGGGGEDGGSSEDTAYRQHAEVLSRLAAAGYSAAASGHSSGEKGISV